MATHYEVLGVGRDASGEEIQRAYRLLARRHHPDVAPDTDRSLMAAINGAWMVLSDPVRRRDYDATLDRPEPAPRPATSTGSRNGPAPDWEPLHWDDEDLDPEDFRDEPYVPVRRRPSDVLVMTPVLLILAAAGGFFFSILAGSSGLRTFSILLVPVSGLGFVLAPLIVMLRSRGGSPE